MANWEIGGLAGSIPRRPGSVLGGLRKRVLPGAWASTGVDDDGGADRWRSIQWEEEPTVGEAVRTSRPWCFVDEAVRRGCWCATGAKDRARRRVVGRSAPPIEAQESPRDFALPDVGTLSRLVEEAVQRGGHQAWGDCVMILATTALRISEVAGLQVGDVDLLHGLLTVRRRRTRPRRPGPRRPRVGGVSGANHRRCAQRWID